MGLSLKAKRKKQQSDDKKREAKLRVKNNF